MGRILNFLCAAVLLLKGGSLAAQVYTTAEPLRGHVNYLADERLAGRRAGSEGEVLAAEYVYDRLNAAGAVLLTPRQGQDFSIETPQGLLSSRNIVAIVEGSDPQLREQYIVVGANLDHLGTQEVTVDGRSLTQVYPGADKNASGLACLIELARMAAANRYMLQRSVIFVAFGAQEEGLAGSWYFVNRAFTEIGSVKAMVNLDMLGHSGQDHPLRVYSSISRSVLNALIDKTLEEPVLVPPVASDGLVRPSDHLAFHERGIPFFCFTTGAARETRTVRDLPSTLDYDNMGRLCNFLFYFIKTLSCEKVMLQSGAPVEVKKEEGVYLPADCDRRPMFFNGDERKFLTEWVYKYLKYPREAIDAGIQGTVQVGFIVEKDGSVSNVEVVRGVDELLDAEAVKVIGISPKWSPGKIDGKAVRTRLVLPVEFRLRK